MGTYQIDLTPMGMFRNCSLAELIGYPRHMFHAAYIGIKYEVYLHTRAPVPLSKDKAIPV